MEKPLKRSLPRLIVGRFFYYLKTYFYWYFSGVDFASKSDTEHLPFVVAEHQTILLRKLRNVDMRMQQNKIKNLRIAIQRLDGVVLEPGQIFSFGA